MRAGPWLITRDIGAARLSWERARQTADALPDDDPDRVAMRIAPRAMLCVTAMRGVETKLPANVAVHFDELRQLCALNGDSASLARGLAGMASEQMFHGRLREASELASELLTLLQSVDDPTRTVGVASFAVAVQYEVGEVTDILRWSQTVIDAAEGDLAKGAGAEDNLVVASPLPIAVLWRGIARCWLVIPGWREDLDDAVAMARLTDPTTLGAVVQWRHRFAIPNGILRVEDSAVGELEEAVRIAQEMREDTALGSAKRTLGVVLTHRDDPTDQQRGLELLTEVRDLCMNGRFPMSELPVIVLYAAAERARRGDRDSAIPEIQQAVDDMFTRGQLAYCVAATSVLVETLLGRGDNTDVTDAQTAIERLSNNLTEEGLAVRDITLLRLRALLSRARGDDVNYRDFVARYREMAKTLGFEGHIAMADAM